MNNYKSRSARDACESGYGNESYWNYLDTNAQEKHDYYAARGMFDKAEEMLIRTLGESLVGNDGD